VGSCQSKSWLRLEEEKVVGDGLGTEKASRRAKPAQAVSAGVAADTTVMTRNRKVVIST
jgi:hypothetical protein